MEQTTIATKKRGRPRITGSPEDPALSVGLCMAQSDWARLKAAAANQGVGHTTLVRDVVRDYLASIGV
jgi:hypothetical protein